MNENLTPEQISEALFHTDPMHTCCKDNDCFDEYDAIADGVQARLVEGLSLEAALRSELAEWFDEDMAEDANLEVVIARLENSQV
ncbi:MAG: hypothetical protein R6W86_16470 [Marinobacter sp.]|uniref:hypothetical protein n=1 Tax=Marinobacter sp. TaxID=50741 RepID=UPI00396D6CF4